MPVRGSAHGDFVKGLSRCSKLPKMWPLDSAVETRQGPGCASSLQWNHWSSFAHEKRFHHRKSVKIFTQNSQQALNGMLGYLNRLLHHFLNMDLPKHSSASQQVWHWPSRPSFALRRSWAATIGFAAKEEELIVEIDMTRHGPHGGEDLGKEFVELMEWEGNSQAS